MELELVDNATLENGKEKAASEEKTSYEGPERRSCQRRCGHDRRNLIRFELDKEDRRRMEDRRTTTNVWDNKHTLF